MARRIRRSQFCVSLQRLKIDKALPCDQSRAEADYNTHALKYHKKAQFLGFFSQCNLSVEDNFYASILRLACVGGCGNEEVRIAIAPNDNL